MGTVLNKALGHQLKAEVLHDDPAVLNWMNGRGFEAEAVTTELILRGRNSYNMSSEYLDDVLSTQGKLCHATERCVGPPEHMLFDQYEAEQAMKTSHTDAESTATQRTHHPRNTTLCRCHTMF